MFRRKDRREDSSGTHVVERNAHEFEALKARLVELEQVLGHVLEASDGLLVDLRDVERERQRLARQVAPGFAEAWSRSDPPRVEIEDFFAVSQVDKRARRWLLASN